MILQKIFRKVGYELKPIQRFEKVSLQPEHAHLGNVLLSYIVSPFLLKEGEPVSNAHQHDWISWKMADTFLHRGYHVDVIDYRDTVFKPEKEYAFFIGARTNFQRIASLLNKNCVKIVHLDMAHWLVNNHAAYQRCLAVQKRKGVTLNSCKMEEANLAIEHADLATMNAGNQFNTNTYRYADKPIYEFPLPACATYAWPQDKDFDKCRNNFLWIGSRGLVHKGLDLVLEAFSSMPEYTLYVCGPVQTKNSTSRNTHFYPERDFETAYEKELYNTPNIRTIGWVDIDDTEFIEIANKCNAVVYPSCSECSAGAVVTCMQTGLIPCVSFEASVNVSDFGLTFSHCTIENIRATVKVVASMPTEELRSRSEKAWKFANKYHTRGHFSARYEQFVDDLLKKI